MGVQVFKSMSQKMLNKSSMQPSREPEGETPWKQETGTNVEIERTDNLDNLMINKYDQYDYQRHITTIYEHSLEIDGMELSERKEKTTITKIDQNHPDAEDFIGNIVVEVKSIDNLELKITTILTENDTIVDCVSETCVYEGNNRLRIKRSMNFNELRQFKSNWRKIWHPHYSEDSVIHEVLNEPEKCTIKNIPPKQIPYEMKKASQLEKSENSNNMYSRNENREIRPSGWETYIEVTAKTELSQIDPGAENLSQIKHEKSVKNEDKPIHILSGKDESI